MTPVGKIDDTDTTHSNDIPTKVVRQELKDTQYKAVMESKNEVHAKHFLDNFKMTEAQRKDFQTILKQKQDAKN